MYTGPKNSFNDGGPEVPFSDSASNFGPFVGKKIKEKRKNLEEKFAFRIYCFLYFIKSCFHFLFVKKKKKKKKDKEEEKEKEKK